MEALGILAAVQWLAASSREVAQRRLGMPLPWKKMTKIIQVLRYTWVSKMKTTKCKSVVLKKRSPKKIRGFHECWYLGIGVRQRLVIGGNMELAIRQQLPRLLLFGIVTVVVEVKVFVGRGQIVDIDVIKLQPPIGLILLHVLS